MNCWALTVPVVEGAGKGVTYFGNNGKIPLLSGNRDHSSIIRVNGDRPRFHVFIQPV
jgi:hypothetical protein